MDCSLDPAPPSCNAAPLANFNRPGDAAPAAVKMSYPYASDELSNAVQGIPSVVATSASEQHVQPSPRDPRLTAERARPRGQPRAPVVAADSSIPPSRPAAPGEKLSQDSETCTAGDHHHDDYEPASGTTQSSDGDAPGRQANSEAPMATTAICTHSKASAREANSPVRASTVIIRPQLASAARAVNLLQSPTRTQPSTGSGRPSWTAAASAATPVVGTVRTAPAASRHVASEPGGGSADHDASVKATSGSKATRDATVAAGGASSGPWLEADGTGRDIDGESQQEGGTEAGTSGPDQHAARHGRSSRVRRQSTKAAEAMQVKSLERALTLRERRRRSSSDYVPADASESSGGGMEAVCCTKKDIQIRKKRGRPKKHADVDPGKKRRRPKLTGCASDSDADAPTTQSGGLTGRKNRGQASASLIKGVYHKELANAYEAQLALEPLRKLLKATGHPDLEDTPTQYYLGLFKYVVDKPGDKSEAKDMATRAIDRVILKVLEGKLPEKEVDNLLNFSMSSYRDPEDVHMRQVLTAREYVTQMMITGFQRLHAAEGSQERSRLGVYPKKSRKDGVVRTWEARVTQSGIKSFSTYPSLQEAQKAYDLGIILLYGTHKRLNNLLTTYYAHGKFLPDIVIPPAVAGSVALHIDYVRKSDEDEKTDDSLQMMRRICGYFGDDAQLPPAFYQYPQLIDANQQRLADEGNSGVEGKSH